MQKIEFSGLVGFVNTATKHDPVMSPRNLETFLFELSTIMKKYRIAKVDLCLDPFEMADQAKQDVINKLNNPDKNL